MVSRQGAVGVGSSGSETVVGDQWTVDSEVAGRQWTLDSGQ